MWRKIGLINFSWVQILSKLKLYYWINWQNLYNIKKNQFHWKRDIASISLIHKRRLATKDSGKVTLRTSRQISEALDMILKSSFTKFLKLLIVILITHICVEQLVQRWTFKISTISKNVIMPFFPWVKPNGVLRFADVLV